MTSEWRPIETAPKDGTRILGFLPETTLEDDFHAPDDILIVQWDHHYEHGDGWLIDREEQFAAWCNPTYWMPLPEPPAMPRHTDWVDTPINVPTPPHMP